MAVGSFLSVTPEVGAPELSHSQVKGTDMYPGAAETLESLRNRLCKLWKAEMGFCHCCPHSGSLQTEAEFPRSRMWISLGQLSTCAELVLAPWPPSQP